MPLFEKPILIAGAGPVGLSLALALAKKGIASHVFEKDEKLPDEIRASTFHAATMEKMAKWEVIDEVLEKGHKVHNLQFWDRQTRSIVGDFDYQHIEKDTPFPFRLQCPQHVYAGVLLERLKKEPLVKVHMSHKFLKAEEKDSYITASFQCAKEVKTYQGALLCGADGAKSRVRESLGIGFEGMTYEDRFLLVGTDLDLEKYYPGISSVNYIFDPKEWVIILRLKNLLRIVFQVQKGQSNEQALLDENIKRLVYGFCGEKVLFPILHKSIYSVHQRVAKTFRVGRSLLLGDAAHINNPASGMGMNSGILDADYLAEKIELYGREKDAIHLDAYEEKRRAYALERIKSYTKKRYEDMKAQTPKERESRNLQFQSESRSPIEARKFLLQASMLEHRI